MAHSTEQTSSAPITSREQEAMRRILFMPLSIAQAIAYGLLGALLIWFWQIVVLDVIAGLVW